MVAEIRADHASYWYERVHKNTSAEIFSERAVPAIVGTVAQRIVTISGYAIFSLSVFFAATIGVGGVLTGVPLEVLPAVFCSLLIGGIAFHIAARYVNLSDPATRNRIRQEVHFEFEDFKLQMRESSASLLQKEASVFIQTVAQKFGWQSLIKYQIPRPTKLGEILRFQAPLLTPAGYLSLYTEVSQAVRQSNLSESEKAEYSLPPPSDFAGAWQAQIKRRISTPAGFVSFIESVDAKVLESAGVLSSEDAEELQNIKKTIQLAHARYNKDTEELRMHRDTALLPFRRKLDLIEKKASTAYGTDSVHAELRAIRRDYLKVRAYIENLISEHPDRTNALDEYAKKENMLSLISQSNPSRESRMYVAREHRKNVARCKSAVRRVEQKFAPSIDAYEKRYEQEKAAKIRYLEVARKKRDTLITSARKEFDRRGEGIFNEYQVLTRESREAWSREVESKRLRVLFILRGSA